MEAKRQRRKESRAAAPGVTSEAEFLARRAPRRLPSIRQSEDYIAAVIEDNILVEHYVDKASATSLIGNIYVGGASERAAQHGGGVHRHRPWPQRRVVRGRGRLVHACATGDRRSRTS